MWASVSSGTTSSLSGIWGSGPNDIWAVGGVVHWNGSAWAAVSSGTTRGMSGIWGSGPDDLWAVGDGGTILRHRN